MTFKWRLTKGHIFYQSLLDDDFFVRQVPIGHSSPASCRRCLFLGAQAEGRGAAAAGGMAGGGPDPVAALRALLDAGRLAEAAHLALDALHVWDDEVPAH